MRILRTLVVDDEPLARQRLNTLLDATEGVERIGEASTGKEALEAITNLAPDVVFLDIEMPELSGMEVMAQLNPRPQIILTTAYENYALRAFEHHATDYLLKPFTAQRLATAVERARATLELEEGPTQRLFVRERGRILAIPVSEIVRLEADGDYVQIVASGRKHLITGTLRDLHRRLGSSQFLRVHRSHLVNIDFVDSFEPGPGGRFYVRFGDGSQVLASRTRSKELRGRVL